MDATRLVARRTELGWSQADLEEKSGVSEDTLSRAENGRRIRLALAKTIADALQTSLSELVPRSLDPAPFEPPRVINITAVPETSYQRLVGRDGELKRLDEAWADPNTNILSLIAEGGTGKTALVNEWLKVMRANQYRGARTVLGWSFYNQGTKERTTSAEPFLDWALVQLGIEIGPTSATAKGDAIAEALAQRRVLLVLDGVEPLLVGLDRQQGQLKDVGLRQLLRRFAAMPPGENQGLVVITSRLAIKEIALWRVGAAPVLDLETLSGAVGSELLRDNGVWGAKKELLTAVRDFGGLPLALDLLASFLKETQFGDARRRDRIRQFLADPESPLHDHAKRLMESYEKEWLSSQPVAHAVMRIVGLFDRPASGDCLTALRREPTIPGITDALVGVDQATWQRAISRLREVRLLSPRNPSALANRYTWPLVLRPVYYNASMESSARSRPMDVGIECRPLDSGGIRSPSTDGGKSSSCSRAAQSMQVTSASDRR